TTLTQVGNKYTLLRKLPIERMELTRTNKVNEVNRANDTNREPNRASEEPNHPNDKQIKQINVNRVGWLLLASFKNYSQWSNGAISMELFSICSNR
ncbi:14104_t:CDS:2, partial [Dentiscutata heterogama]